MWRWGLFSSLPPGRSPPVSPAQRPSGPACGVRGPVDAVPRGGKLHLRVHACVTVCEHLVGGGGMRVRLCSLGPTTERAGGQPAASQDGDPCVSSEGKEKQRKNENSKVRAGLAGEEGAGHGRCPRLPLDGRLVNKLDWFSSEQVKRPRAGRGLPQSIYLVHHGQQGEKSWKVLYLVDVSVSEFSVF